MENEQISIECFDATPEGDLISVLANDGYTIETAVADIIDNSITAESKKIEFYFDFNDQESSIEFLDDGWGMTLSELKDAIRYAKKSMCEERSSTDLGRFSVGLNTASSSFCDDLFVVSKKNGETNAVEFPFYRKEWTGYVVGAKGRPILSRTGTLVRWEKLHLVSSFEENSRLLCNREELSVICDRISKHIGRVFCHFIMSGVEIFVNGNKVRPWSPFNIEKAEKIASDTWKVKDPSRPSGEQSIKIESYVIPTSEQMSPAENEYAKGGKASLAERQGFYIYRGNRLVVDGSWVNLPLGIDQKSAFARIGIWYEPSVALDNYLGINYLKDSVTFPVEFADRLLKIAKIARNKSANNYNYKKNKRPYQKRKKDESSPVWNATIIDGEIRVAINPLNPLIKKYTEKLTDNEKKRLFAAVESTLPLDSFLQFKPKKNDYSKNVLKDMLIDSFNCQKNKGKSDEAAWNSVLESEPFCDSKYINICIEILSEIKINEGETE